MVTNVKRAALIFCLCLGMIPFSWLNSQIVFSEFTVSNWIFLFLATLSAPLTFSLIGSLKKKNRNTKYFLENYLIGMSVVAVLHVCTFAVYCVQIVLLGGGFGWVNFEPVTGADRGPSGPAAQFYVMRRIITNPILLWILSVVSLGHFVILWSWLLANEVNRHVEDERLSMKVHAKILAASYMLLVTMYFSLFNERLFHNIETSAIFPYLHLVYFLIFLLMLADILYLVGATTRMINLASDECIPAPSWMMIGLFLLFIPLPYLQARFNRVNARHNQTVEPTC